MIRLLRLTLVFACFGLGGSLVAQSRAAIIDQLQSAEDALHDVPGRALIMLESIAKDPVLQENPDLRLRHIRLMLDYEDRMKVYSRTEKLLEEGFSLLPQVQDSKAEIHMLLGKAAYAYENEKIDGVRTALNRAYDLSIKIGDTESQATILHEQGNLDRLELNYQAALVHYLQAIELVKNQTESDAYIKVANELALFYLDGLSVRYDQGVKILEDLVKTVESSVKPRRQDLQALISNLGAAYATKGDLAKARQSFERAIKLGVEIEDWTGVAYCQKYIGGVLVKEKKWAEALPFFKKAYAYFVKTKNMYMTVQTAGHMMNVQLELGDAREAAEHWKIVQTAADRNLPLDERVDHMRLKGRLAAAEHRWKEAYDAFEQMNRLEDKLNAQKNADSARYYSALFNIERKEQENRRLEQKGRVQVLQLDNNRKQGEVLSWILISASVIACIFAVDFMRVRKRRRKIQDLTTSVQKNVLQRYLPNQIVQAVLTGQQNLDDTPQQRRITLLHCEICDFTRAVDLLGPQRIGRILNTYLAEMIDVIGSEGGMIDKFVNGSILAVFGAPQAVPEAQQAQAAARCARKMQSRLEELNKTWQRTEGWLFAMRIGIHQGDCLVGTLGAEPRIDYTVLGPSTDAVLQISSRGSPGDMLVSSGAAAQLEPGQLSSISRLRVGTDGEVYSLQRAGHG